MFRIRDHGVRTIINAPEDSPPSRFMARSRLRCVQEQSLQRNPSHGAQATPIHVRAAVDTVGGVPWPAMSDLLAAPRI